MRCSIASAPGTARLVFHLLFFWSPPLAYLWSWILLNWNILLCPKPSYWAQTFLFTAGTMPWFLSSYVFKIQVTYMQKSLLWFIWVLDHNGVVIGGAKATSEKNLSLKYSFFFRLFSCSDGLVCSLWMWPAWWSLSSTSTSRGWRWPASPPSSSGWFASSFQTIQTVNHLLVLIWELKNSWNMRNQQMRYSHISTSAASLSISSGFSSAPSTSSPCSSQKVSTSGEGVDPLTRAPLTRGYFWPEFFLTRVPLTRGFWPEDFWPEGSFEQRVYLTRGSMDWTRGFFDQSYFPPEVPNAL